MIKKLIIAVVAIAITGVAFTAHSYTASALSINPVISRDLAIGSSGTDVVYLQAFLQNRGHLVIPYTTPKGYFGPLTRNAVILFQVAQGISPTGVFDAATRVAYNNQSNAGQISSGCLPGFTPTVYNGINVCALQVPGTIDQDDNDELEGDEDAEIVEVEFDVEDGDIEINRAEFNFEFTGSSNAEDRPWNVFDKITLFADGDEVAHINSDDEDEWDEENNDTYQITFSDFDYIVRENDTANLTLEVDISDDIDSDEDNSWEIAVTDDGIRGIDADDETQEIGDEDETITITIENEDGNDDDDDNNNDDGLTISDSDENPDQRDLQVFDDQISSWVTIFAFEISAEDEEFSISELPITLEFENNSSYDDVIEDIELEIDGDSFDDVDVDSEDNDITTVTFDLDDYSIDEGDTVTVFLRVRFMEADNNFDDGDRIQAYIDSENVENIIAENEDGDDVDEADLHGDAEGEVHTLEVNS